MIPARDTWRDELAAAYRSLDELVAAGLLAADEAATLHAVAGKYQISVPRYYAGLFDRAASQCCPIRAQALPQIDETDPELPPWARQWSRAVYGRDVPWSTDPIGDVAKLAAPRLTHRYGNRALLHISAACALYCRFCFRKSHLNDAERTLYNGSLAPALRYLQDHPEIREVILTGGDPLAMTDVWLEDFFSKIAEVRHIRQVRLHSRMAVTLPRRLTTGLADICGNQSFGVSLVSHFNHPRELTPLALDHLTRMRRAGVPLYNQTVLLAGVNDGLETLYTLFQTLYEAGVTPFYLHHPDWTAGTFHFRLPISRGRLLMEQLSGRLSGPALPSYVLDVPGGWGKTHLLSSRVEAIEQRETADLCGVLYKVRSAHTRSGSAETHLYCDLWRPRLTTTLVPAPVCA